MFLSCKIFSHDYQPSIVFSTKLQQTNSLGANGKIKEWDQEFWRGYVCTKCGKRKIEELYKEISSPTLNQKAFDWLHHKAKRVELLQQIKENL